MGTWEEFKERHESKTREKDGKSVAAHAASSLTIPERRRLLERARAALAGTDSVKEWRRWLFLRNEVKQGRLKPGS